MPDAHCRRLLLRYLRQGCLEYHSLRCTVGFTGDVSLASGLAFCNWSGTHSTAGQVTGHPPERGLSTTGTTVLDMFRKSRAAHGDLVQNGQPGSRRAGSSAVPRFQRARARGAGPGPRPRAKPARPRPWPWRGQRARARGPGPEGQGQGKAEGQGQGRACPPPKKGIFGQSLACPNIRGWCRLKGDRPARRALWFRLEEEPLLPSLAALERQCLPQRPSLQF